MTCSGDRGFIVSSLSLDLETGQASRLTDPETTVICYEDRYSAFKNRRVNSRWTVSST